MLLGIAIITGNNDLSFDNLLDDYSLIFASGPGLVARCITGLGPNGDDNTDLGGWFFSGLPVFNRECSGLVIQQDGALMRGQVGVVDLYQCLTLSTSAEGIYTCMIMNSSMMIQTMRVGLYFDGRSKLLSYHLSVIYNCYRTVSLFTCLLCRCSNDC